uniref:Uncharacterized protein n=1 Tax=Solanum tuberosum TaxID=4113 RepID=M1DVC7_SOLTU
MAITLPKVSVCQALKVKIKSVMEWSSLRVIEWFCDAVLDRPKLQDLKMLKAKAKRLASKKSNWRIAKEVGEPDLDRRWTQDIFKVESVKLGDPRSNLRIANQVSDHDLVRHFDPYINWTSCKTWRGKSPLGVSPSGSASKTNIAELERTERNKAAERTKKTRPGDRLIHWASRRMSITSPKVSVCQALKEKIKSAMEWSSRRVAEWFRDAVFDHPKLQN